MWLFKCLLNEDMKKKKKFSIWTAEGKAQPCFLTTISWVRSQQITASPPPGLVGKVKHSHAPGLYVV